MTASIVVLGGVASKRCPQCWKVKPLEAFAKVRGEGWARTCAVCRRRYGGWTALSFTEKLARMPARKDLRSTGRVLWVASSGNEKLGGIPASMSERGTCPSTCDLYDAGCYASYGKLGGHWKAVGSRGLHWQAFLRRVENLPDGQLWRHNVAGDLQGRGVEVDADALGELVEANRGRRGFTFTHKTAADNFEALQAANLNGFTINLSADTLEEADSFFQDGDLRLTKAGPVVVLLPADAPEKLTTPEGRAVIVCPAETRGLTCAECELCAKPFRSAIIGFRAHGQFRKHVPELVHLRRKERAE